MIKISIIICTYNRCELLINTLNSLKKLETFKEFDYEVLVIDNNSIDNTNKIIINYERIFEGKLRYFIEKSQGLSFSRNRGILESKGEIIAFTDDDCIVDNKWLIGIYKSFIPQDVKCVGGRIVPIWEIAKPRWLIKELYGRLALLDYGNESFQISDEKYNIFGANMAFRKTLFANNCFFNTKLGRRGNRLFSGEDSAVISKIVKSKEKVIYQADILVQHFISKDRMNKKYFRRWHIDTGVSYAMMPDTENVKHIIFNIPRYQVRLFMKTIYCYFISLLTMNQDYFFYECKLFYFISYFKTKISIAVKKPDNIATPL